MRQLSHGVGHLVVAALLATSLGATKGRAQAIEVVRTTDRPSGMPDLRLTSFPPGAEVDVSFTRTAPDGRPPSFRSRARYKVDADGRVALATAPLGGDWSSPIPEAPLWTMREDASAPVLDPSIVRVEAVFGSLRRTADVRIESSPGVTIEPIARFAGAFLALPAQRKKALPLVIVLAGSEGDDRSARLVAPLLAARGYAALGLPYVSRLRGGTQAIPGLPSSFSRIPIDRLEDAYRWVSRDPRVDRHRVGLWGISKGGEFAILAAATYTWLDAVAAIVPSDVVWEGFSYENTAGTGAPSFTWRGRPLPYVPYSAPGRGRDVKDAGRRADPARAAAAAFASNASRVRCWWLAARTTRRGIRQA